MRIGQEAALEHVLEGLGGGATGSGVGHREGDIDAERREKDVVVVAGGELSVEVEREGALAGRGAGQVCGGCLDARAREQRGQVIGVEVRASIEWVGAAIAGVALGAVAIKRPSGRSHLREVDATGSEDDQREELESSHASSDTSLGRCGTWVFVLLRAC